MYWFLVNCIQEQKEAIEKGLVTMQDVEMAAAEGLLSFPFLFFWTKNIIIIFFLAGDCK